MMQPSKIPFRKKSGTTPAGMLGAAVVSVLLLCGAGNTPTGNLQTSDLNANGHAITNAATVSATNIAAQNYSGLPISPVVYYTSTTCTSDAGALLNTSLASGASFSGVSDQTTKLQAIFNHASTGTPIVVVWDGAYSTSAPITVYGNTRVIALHNCGLVLRNSASCPMFENAHISTGAGSFGTITDRNVSFDGGLWNGNAQNQAHDNSTYGWTTGFKFWGVDTVRMENMTIFDSRTFAYHFANWKHVTMRNIKVYEHTATSSFLVNQDGEHFNGPGYDLSVDGLTANCNDDALAINADDGNPANFSPGYGPITGVTARDIYLDNTGSAGTGGAYGQKGVRLTSGADAIDQVLVDGVYGLTNYEEVIIDSSVAGNNPGSGNLSRITFRNLDATVAQNGDENAYVYVNSVMTDLSLNYHVNHAYGGTGYGSMPMLEVNSGGNISSLKVTGNVAGEATTQPTPDFYIPGGTVNNWSLQMNSYSSTSGQADALIWMTGAANINLQMTDCQLHNGTAGILNNAGTGAATISIVNSSYSNASNTAAIFNNSGSGSLTYSLAGFSETGASALTSGTCTLSTTANAALNKVTAGAGFQDQASGHANAPSAFDGSGNIVPITVGSGLTYNTSTKTLTASGGSYSAGTGLTLSGTTFSLTSPVSVSNGGTGITSFGTGVATGLAANVNSGAGFETASNAASTYLALSGGTITGPATISSSTNPQLTLQNGAGSITFGTDSGSTGTIGGSAIVINASPNTTELNVGNGQAVSVVATNTGNYSTGMPYNGGFTTASSASIGWSSGVNWYTGQDTYLSRSSAGVVSVNGGAGSIIIAGMTLGGGTKVSEIKIITGTLASGAATLSDASITATSAIIPTHLGSSVTNAGSLFAYPTGSGTGAVKSTNGSDNDTFTAMVVNH